MVQEASPIIRANSLYKIVDGRSWTQAEANSVILGGHLTSINDSSENDYIFQSFNPVIDTGSAWIGISDKESEGQWVTTDGQLSQYFAWAVNEPNNIYNGGPDEDYGVIAFDSFEGASYRGRWNDLPNSLESLSLTDWSSIASGIAEIPLSLSITRQGEVKEGAGLFKTSINITAGTQASGNLADGSKVWWQVTGITSDDLASGNLSGSGVITNGKLEFESSLKVDADAGENFAVSVYSDANKTQQIGTTSSVVVKESNTAPTNLTTTATSFNENIAVNSIVATLSSVDPDAGNIFTYALVPGDGSTDNAAFSISGNQLKINASPNFESKLSYSVRVQTKDQGGLFFEKNLTFSVNDLPEEGNYTGIGKSKLTGTLGDDTYTGTNSNNTFKGLGGYDRASRTGDSSNYTVSGTSTSAVVESITTVKKGKTTSTVVTLLDTLSNTESVQINGGISSNTINAGGETTKGITRTTFSGTFIAFGGAGVDTITGGTFKNWLGGQGFAAGVISGIETIKGTTSTTNGAMDIFDLRNDALTGPAYVGGGNADYAKVNNFNIGIDRVVLSGKAADYKFAFTQVKSGGKVKIVTDEYWGISTAGGDLIAQVRGNGLGTLSGFDPTTSLLYGNGDQTSFGLGF